ncbi:MAG: bifunctional phosphopantothenoylcysteine decarboxylase/phosphopantothenate--cysteine ligase CoaBC [Candidatus Micrarchaeia archaeon]|jgi:phosphopantothenoylcysteine decarboxylase/phosphopantothenate--cysteine ligase
MATKPPLSGKTIILGISGSVACTKSAQVARLLRKKGAQVFPLITPSAKELLLEKGVAEIERACGNKSATELFDSSVKRAAQKGILREHKSRHIALSARADLMLIAPASANTINKMGCGITEETCGNADLLLSLYLSLPTHCAVALAPAMHPQMWNHPATRKSVSTLKERGVFLIGPATGRLASGDQGIGRMAEPAEIAEEVEKLLGKKELAGVRVLVTAGPTKEYLDEVRFVSNDSSGMTGCEIAREAFLHGAKVTVVLGPAGAQAEEILPKGARVLRITNAEELFEASKREFPKSGLSFFAAAVADFAPAGKAQGKIRKGELAGLLLKLVQTPDTLAYCGKRKKRGQLVVGFALESGDLEKNARKKLLEKNADLIVANPPIAAGGEKSQVTLVWRGGTQRLAMQSKKTTAQQIVAKAIRLRNVK